MLKIFFVNTKTGVHIELNIISEKSNTHFLIKLITGPVFGSGTGFQISTQKKD